MIIFLYYDLDKFGITINLLSLWTLYTVKSERAESISLHVILGSLFLVSGFLSIVKIIGLFFWFGSFKSLQLKHHGYGIILNTLRTKLCFRRFYNQKILNLKTFHLDQVIVALMKHLDSIVV